MKKFRTFVCKSFLLGLASIALLSGCSLWPSAPPRLTGNRAFIAYWPPANTNRLKLAVKDNIDVKGVVTTAGSKRLDRNGGPAWKDASCLAIARQRNVHIVGKANLSEFATAPSGYNEYFGTPASPLSSSNKLLLPGGSSCGSAVAVASGMADVAFGTDTAGSIRVPAAWCGVVGLKTTHGLVPLDGVFPIEAKHLDTVGPMGKDIAHTVQGMDLLQNGFAALYAAAVAARPSAQEIRIGRLTLKGTDAKIDQAVDEALARTGFQVVPLDDSVREEWERAKKDGNAIAATGVWINYKRLRFKLGVSARTKTAIRTGQVAKQTSYESALARQAAWQNTLKEIFTKVDFIALPTVQSPPPAIPPNLKIGFEEARVLDLQNTVAVNFAGNPALALPIPLHDADVAVTSLQLIGPWLSEAQLLNAGRLVEAAVKDGGKSVAVP